MLPTIAWDGDVIVMIDQRKLPGREVYVRCKTGNEVAKAITTMVIRGAPAIGVAAAMGLALGAARSTATGTKQFAIDFQRLADVLAATRPTAVNLFWAIERMRLSLAAGVSAGEGVVELAARLRKEADAIHDADVDSCRAIGRHGAELVPDGARILTHCNAGALATAGYGTALGVVRGAIDAGKRVTVMADETRPFLQGARLTAWELVKDGIPTTVITDNMAAAMMAAGHVDLVVVGADRIAANGDAANKIGTYGLAIIAQAHGLPFYVAAPWSTIDLQTPTGAGIPIEERNAREVTHMAGTQVTPDGAAVRNPAFDVTPSRYITAIVTERGVVRPPYLESLAAAAC
jgi:methylthioribose-1-phosphate isomerase